MYDTVIGSRPREQGLNDVQRPAAYSIPRDLADSKIATAAAADDDDDMTASAREDPMPWAANIASSNPTRRAGVVPSSSSPLLLDYDDDTAPRRLEAIDRRGRRRRGPARRHLPRPSVGWCSALGEDDKDGDGSVVRSIFF